jgi:hypothetical protein
MSNRENEDWIDAFQLYANKAASPDIFRKWAAISLIGAALERKVWSSTAMAPVYPNMYIFLIGPPAAGKTLMTSLAWRTLSQLKDHKISSSSVTRATIIEELNKAERFATITEGDKSSTQAFNALYVVANELGVLLPAYEMEFLNKLTDIYDNHPYSESRRDKKHNVDIKRPTINLLAAGTPGYLGSIIPEVAWEQGFLSRVIMVYSGQGVKRSLWEKQKVDTSLWEKLILDLRLISRISGEFRYTDEASQLLDDFHTSGFLESEPLHPKLHHYNSRRAFHLMKLMMISSAARHSHLVIEEQDYYRAFEWLIEAEDTMPEIFKAMTTGGDSQVIRDAWHFLYEIYLKTKKPIPEKRLYAFLAQRVPSEKARHIIDLMVNGGLIKADGYAGSTRTFMPEGDPNVT